MGALGAEPVLQLVKHHARVRGQGSPGGGQDDQPPPASGRVGHELEQAVAHETAHEVLSGLAAGAEAACERGGWHAVRAEVGEYERLRGSGARPGELLEPVEQLLVEPAAGPEEQQAVTVIGRALTLAKQDVLPISTPGAL